MPPTVPPAETLLSLYRSLLEPRMIEEKMLILLRQGKISKWFSGIGQEAIAVGAAAALDPDEFIFPLHRNLGVFTVRKLPLPQLFAQLQGKPSGFSKGRERSFHFGTMKHRVVGMISHLGPQLALADGVALAHKLKGEKKITLAFSGEGGTSEGDFHEALNVAAVWKLPVIFLVENNGYALSTPVREQFAYPSLCEHAKSYGIEAIRIDGNDLLEVYQTVSEAAASMRNTPRPYFIECMTFRMKGHEEASGTKYVPPELFREWEKRDPILRFEEFLFGKNILTDTKRETIRAQLQSEIDAAVEIGFNAPECEPDFEAEIADVFAPEPPQLVAAATGPRTKRRFVDAISDGLRLSMRKFPNAVIMGQDVAEYGGVFKITEGFLAEFGRERIRNTPLCESAIVGAGLGLSFCGIKSVVEMQFADFVSCAFTQIVNNLAKVHYRWGENADVVIRMPTGAGVRAGPFHSQSNESWFFHVPGLVILYPAFPSDAKGLLSAAIASPNPVLFFEHKALYRSIEEEIPEEYYVTEIGKARLVREGNDATIITYGAGVHWALQTLDRHPEVSADLIDLRTLAPLDWPCVFASVRKTGRAIVLHEDTLTGGIGAEIAARISSELFTSLDAPVLREAALDTPVPFAAPLEDQFLPKSRFEARLLELIQY